MPGDRLIKRILIAEDSAPLALACVEFLEQDYV